MEKEKKRVLCQRKRELNYDPASKFLVEVKPLEKNTGLHTHGMYGNNLSVGLTQINKALIHASFHF